MLASEEQKAYWLPKANNFEISGAYVQTELGHGSDVGSLETTATYDAATKEFVVHTPCRSATKFWPGGLGKTSTHCVLYARLISLGVDHGVAAFIIQIRDLQTHAPLPGIEIGDVGSKVGFQSSDQGFMSFNQVRYPKSILLSKYVNISDSGEFKAQSSNSKRLTYGGMLNLRALIVNQAHHYIATMAVIAARYSFKRRQFAGRDGDNFREALIIQYQMQNAKVVPAFSYAWATLLTYNQLMAMYEQYK